MDQPIPPNSTNKIQSFQREKDLTVDETGELSQKSINLLLVHVPNCPEPSDDPHQKKPRKDRPLQSGIPAELPLVVLLAASIAPSLSVFEP